MFCLNRVTIMGSFPLITSPVGGERRRNTADDVFGETTKAVPRSYSADEQRHLRRDRAT